MLEPSALRLRFISLDCLLLHEEEDPYRVKRLVAALQRDEKLRNPPVVTEFEGRYIVLDGATRTSALRHLGCRDVLVQIVNFDDGTVELRTWHHVVVGLSPNRLLANLSQVQDLTLRALQSTAAVQSLGRGAIIACILMRNGQEFAVLGGGDIYRVAKHLCQLVSVYRGKAEVHRTAEINMPTLMAQYPALSAAISFPQFEPAQIFKIAVNNDRLPMGITRHLIYGRALGLDIPLTQLSSPKSLQEKNDWLENRIQMRLRNHKIRLYQEPVFIFDD